MNKNILYNIHQAVNYTENKLAANNIYYDSQSLGGSNISNEKDPMAGYFDETTMQKRSTRRNPIEDAKYSVNIYAKKGME